ncbi:MAG: helix-turn-helix transcriptional regulator [Anaerolineales bacterium]|nr:helix-turn-helix transcriptional regulator [Anaerolineales bacterium]
MPGRGKGGGRRRRVMNFLQPCILVILHKTKAHGYQLISELESFGFRSGQLDPSLIYRGLRELEELGMVKSEWDDDSQGPQKRVYEITEAGEENLIGWIEDLKRTRKEINTVLNAYQSEKDSE